MKRAAGITIVAVQAYDGRWNYGPEGAALTDILCYEEFGEFDTAEEALEQARKDRTVPSDAAFRVMAAAGEGRS